MQVEIPAAKILDFDIENRPLSYLGHDFTTSEITAIAASFAPGDTMYCWLLGDVDMFTMLKGFSELYNQADMVTGHFIRKHDLPIINGAMLENGLEPLSPKLSCDTCLDLITVKGVSKSQESLGDMLGLTAPKVGMSQAKWRDANRLTPEGLAHTQRRVTGDVRQHQELRAKLHELGMLKSPKVWDGKSGR